MAHGAPDDSNILKVGEDYRVDDLGELAARLGSITDYRRDGDVYFMEDFSTGLARWVQDPFGIGSAITVQSDKFLSEGAAVRFDLPADVLSYTRIYRYLPISTTGKVGAGFALDVETEISHADILIRYYSTLGCYEGHIRWTWDSQELSYYDHDGNRVVIATHDYFPNGIGLFVHVKLRLDFTSRVYKTLSIDDTTFDLSGIPLYVWATPLGPYYFMSISVGGTDTAIAEAYLDNIIVTRGEV